MQSLTDFILQYTGHFTLKERGGGGGGGVLNSWSMLCRQVRQEAPIVLDKHSYYFVKTLH